MINERVFDALQSLLLNFDGNTGSMTDDYSGQTLPIFSTKELSDVCEKCQTIFLNEQTVLNLQGDFIVVGDIHGNLFDIIRIFRNYGLPPKQKYLFLGDLIDRGCFSLLVVTLIFTLKIKFPDSIYSIRGNHEFKEVCSTSGFLEEIQDIYKKTETANSIFETFLSVFDCLPLSAVINDSYFCVHGGIGPTFREIHQLTNVTRPLDELYGGISVEILWSDPSEDAEPFKDSERGAGYKFGLEAIHNFLKVNQFRLLIRSHQYVENGFEYSLNNQVLTVFSSSNYCGDSNNSNGVVIIKADSEKEEPIVVGPPIPWITRKDVKLTSTKDRIYEVSLEIHNCKKAHRKVSATPPNQGHSLKQYSQHNGSFASHIKWNRNHRSAPNHLPVFARKSMPSLVVNNQSAQSAYNDYSSESQNEANSKIAEVGDQQNLKLDSSYSNEFHPRDNDDDDDGILIDSEYFPLFKKSVFKYGKEKKGISNEKASGSLCSGFRLRNQDTEIQKRFRKPDSNVKKE